jgi:hypothetical protein
MPNVNLTISGSLINSSNFFVVTAYSDPARTIIAETVIPSKPYGSPFQVTFTTLAFGAMYYFVLWENTTAVPGGTARNSVNFQPNATTTTLRADLYLTADVTPGFTSGGSSYVDASLVGWDYSLEMVGYGTLEDTVDYTQDTGGGWTLLNGQTIGNQQKFVIHFQPQIAQVQTSQPSLINASKLVTTSTSLSNTDKNTAVLIQGASTNIQVGLPALSTMADFDVIYLYSYGGSHINASIPCNGSDTIQRNTVVSKIVLGQNEIARLFKMTIGGTARWYIDNELSGLDCVGELFDAYDTNYINTVPFDGSLLNRSDYERLWDIVSALPTGVLIADSAFNDVDANGNYINKGKFTTGNGTTTFRVPDLTIYPTRRTVKNGGSRLAGSFEAQTIMSHSHTVNRTGYAGIGGSGQKFVGTALNPDAGTGSTNPFGSAENKSSNTAIYTLCKI